MSAGLQDNAAPSANEIQAQAADWVNRRRDGDGWGQEDQAALDAWLAQSPAHLVAYWRLDAAWDRTQRLAALHPLPSEETTSPPRTPLLLMKIAAAFVVVAAGVATAFIFTRPPEHSFATAVGSREILTLADGTRIELNTNTALHLSADQKTVWLDRGEAFFQVKHNAARTFAVMAGGHRVTDLGTKFLVRSDPDRLEVALVEGSVRFDAPDGRMRESLLLAAGDVAVAVARANAITVTRKPAHALTDELGWRRGVLTFDNATLAAAAAEFNRYNQERVVIADPSVALLKIDGTFPTGDIALFARAAQQLFRLRIEKRGEETVISR